MRVNKPAEVRAFSKSGVAEAQRRVEGFSFIAKSAAAE